MKTPATQMAPPSAWPHRGAAIVLGVVALHAGALWALQTGLLRRAMQAVVPVELLATLAAPQVAENPPLPPATPLRAPQPVPNRQPEALPPPQPLAIADTAPAPDAPTGVPQPAPPPPIATPVATATATATPPAPPPARVLLPSSDADYLNNPRPAYPALSKRLGEQGRVVLRVLIGADGLPQRAELRQSSGYDRLDQAALATVLKWHYVPGRRDGVAEAMWFSVPINFVLE